MVRNNNNNNSNKSSVSPMRIDFNVTCMFTCEFFYCIFLHMYVLASWIRIFFKGSFFFSLRVRARKRKGFQVTLYASG